MTTQATIPSFTTAPPPYRAPHDPARVPEIVEALKKVAPLHDLQESEYEWLATHGTEMFAETGAIYFREGDPANKMIILLKGEVYVRREHGGPAALFIGRSGLITGLLPYSRMKAYGGLGYTSTPTWGLEFDRSLFPEMLKTIPALTERFVAILLDRVREVTRMEQQSEKLNALGKLAGNLAHELNNPASAAQRSAAGILEELRVYGHERFNLGRLCLDAASTEKVLAWEEQVRAEAKRLGKPAETEQTRREDEIVTWLHRHEIQESWHIAPELAEFGVLPEQLETLTGYLDPDAIAVVLTDMMMPVMDGAATIRGKVESIARGITDQDNKNGPELLASVNPTFTWVRLAQRIPVRVRLTDVPAGVLIAAGMTCTVVIKESAAAETGAGVEKES